MLALKSLAKSTLGELKDSLLEESDEEEGSTPSPQRTQSQLHSEFFKSEEVDDFALPPTFQPSTPATSAAVSSTLPPSAQTLSWTPQLAAADAAASAPPSASVAHSAIAPQAAAAGASSDSGEALASPSRARKVDLVDALQGQAVVSPQRLSADALEARKQLAAVIAVPGLADVLRRSTANGEDNSIWNGSEEPSVPRIAVQSAAALRALAPKILCEDADSDKQRLLTSFSERYDSLLAQYNTLQQRCREMSEQQTGDENLEQQVETWRSAHRVAQERVESLTLENADLRESYKALERRGIDPIEKKQLLLRLQQREAEVRSAGDALRQLQEVIEDGNGAVDVRCEQLERELTAARQARAEAEAALARQTLRLQEASEKTAAATAEREDMAARCRGIEKDAQETSSALEVLLREKERFLEESEHLIDRRLVTCMLANYLDHLRSGQKNLADAALSQTIQVLGGLPDVEERQRLRAATASSQELGKAFVDFLVQETEGAPGSGSPATS